MFRVSETRDGKIPQESSGMLYLQIFANLSNEIKPVTIEVNSNEYISTVKKMVLEEINDSLIADINNYRLIYKGQELDNESILSDYRVRDWEVLDFYLKNKRKEVETNSRSPSANPSSPSKTSKGIFEDSFLDEKDKFWWQPLFGCILQNMCIADDSNEESRHGKFEDKNLYSNSPFLHSTTEPLINATITTTDNDAEIDITAITAATTAKATVTMASTSS